MENTKLISPYCAIGMVTYNHEKYIEQAIESVMMQVAGFSYKLFIGEDHSTDNTRAICIKMKQNYPDKIELILNEKNLGGGANGYNLFTTIINTGVKFYAILDGDDYWIDKDKLQKQVNILEKNDDFSLCFTRANILTESTGEIKVKSKDDLIPAVMDFDTFVEKGNPYNTCTALFRADRISRKDLLWFSKIIKQDWAIYVMLLDTGKAYYLPDTTAVYRVHGGGIIKSTSKIAMGENSAFLIESLQQYFYPNRHKTLDLALTWSYFHLAFDYWRLFKFGQFFKNIRLAGQTGEKKTFGWYWLVVKQMILNPIKDMYHKILG